MTGWNSHVFPQPRPTAHPSSSWWTAYAAQHSRVAFDRALARELPRLRRYVSPYSLRVNVILAADECAIRAAWQARRGDA